MPVISMGSRRCASDRAGPRAGDRTWRPAAAPALLFLGAHGPGEAESGGDGGKAGADGLDGRSALHHVEHDAREEAPALLVVILLGFQDVATFSNRKRWRRPQQCPAGSLVGRVRMKCSAGLDMKTSGRWPRLLPCRGRITECEALFWTGRTENGRHRGAHRASVSLGRCR